MVTILHSKNTKIEIGVIGAGGISSVVHLPLLSCIDNVSIKFIADTFDPKELAKTYNTKSIKITDRFLTNEVRSDGLKIVVHKKRCNVQQNCAVKKISSNIEHELRVAILKKAVLFEQADAKGKKKYKRLDPK